MTIPQVSEPEPFGPALRTWRAQHNVAQAALARSLGVSPSAVNRWEYGETHPSPRYRKRLAQIVSHEPDSQNFAILLKEIRQKRNTTVRKIAVHLGIDESTVYRWESLNPETQRIPRYADIIAMCRVMRTMPEERQALIVAAGYSIWGQA